MAGVGGSVLWPRWCQFYWVGLFCSNLWFCVVYDRLILWFRYLDKFLCFILWGLAFKLLHLKFENISIEKHVNPIKLENVPIIFKKHLLQSCYVTFNILSCNLYTSSKSETLKSNILMKMCCKVFNTWSFSWIRSN